MSWIRDREWMYEMKNSAGFFNVEYGDNVDKFINFAYSNESVVEKKLTSKGEVLLQIKCPCSRCKNIHYRKREVVETHLLSRGFMPNYYVWDEHGETFIQEVGQSSTPMNDDVDGHKRLVLDSMFPTGYNPTLQSNLDSSMREEHVPKLEDADKPLWEGCTNWSTLQAVTSLLNWKSHCNVPISTFNHILPIFKSMLPKGNNLPQNFYHTKKSLQELSSPKERIDVCKNHCMLFNKKDSLLTHCRRCGESRYKSWVDENELNLVDERAHGHIKKNKRLMIEKYEEDLQDHPLHDQGLLEMPAGGRKRGRLYGANDAAGSVCVLTETPSSSTGFSHYSQHGTEEIERLTKVVEDMEKEKKMEKEKRERERAAYELERERERTALEQARKKATEELEGLAKQLEDYRNETNEKFATLFAQITKFQGKP